MKKIFLSKSKWKKAFTLVEILVAILILSIIIVTGFELYTKAIASKIKIDEQANLEKNIYYFSEKIFQLVKNWWTLDYEEYWNRKMVSANSAWIYEDSSLVDWHYWKFTGFWNFWKNWLNEYRWLILDGVNFWEKFYYCSSSDPNFTYLISLKRADSSTISSWCFLDIHNVRDKNWTRVSNTQLFSAQRYWQYSFNFIDYNSNWDPDNWDEDEDWNIMRDDDDLHLWRWPIAFPENWDIKELYLLSWDKKIRTFIRWNIKQDEFAKTRNSSFICKSDLLNWKPKFDEFKYCQWTIEYLQLEWVDWGLDHKNNTGDEWESDWVVDTWLIAQNFSWKSNIDFNNAIIAWSADDEKFWKPLFSDWINISDFKVFAYPNIDSSKVWNMSEEEQKKFLISPYVVLSFEIRPSWKVKSKISGWEIKPVRFNMTVNLTEVFSK